MRNIFPSELKKANVTPFFKQDDPLDPNNYRNISKTCAFSKIFEKVHYAQITENLNKHQHISQKVLNTRCIDLRYKNYPKRNRFYKKLFMQLYWIFQRLLTLLLIF